MDPDCARTSDVPDEPSFSRRSLLQLAAAGAGPGRCSRATAAEAATEPDGPILKPLPPSQFIVYGTNAETRWDSVDHDRYLTPQRGCSSATTPRPADRRDQLPLKIFGDGLKHERSADEAVELEPCATCTGCHGRA